MTGMTNKQFALQKFFRALTAYKIALQQKDTGGIVRASIQLHAAKGEVPKGLHHLVGRAYRNNGRSPE